MSEPRFRPATNADAEAVRSLVFGILAEYGLACDPAATDRDLFDVESNYAGRGGCFEVLIDESGNIVGSWGLYPLRQSVCELRKMYLDRSHRGRGIGKIIVKRAIERARALGFGRIELETARVLGEAISLYNSFGFKPFVPEHMSCRCDQAMFLELTGSTENPLSVAPPAESFRLGATSEHDEKEN